MSYEELIERLRKARSALTRAATFEGPQAPDARAALAELNTVLDADDRERADAARVQCDDDLRDDNGK